MGKLLFNLENVDVTYRDLIVLRQVNLQITQGEKIVIVGPCGAGKTTLLNRLYQLRPSDCAFIHQHFDLAPRISAFHNIYAGREERYSTFYNLLNRIKPQKKVVEEIRSILKTVGMEESLFEKTGRLSDSRQQRVAVGRALYRGSRILLADEPIAALNFLQANAILDLFAETEGTVVMTLHSVELTLKYAHRIVGLCAGRIRFDLPVDQVTPDHITDLYLSC